MRDINIILRFVVLAGVASMAGACTTTRAAAPLERPALAVPPPPPRIVVPLPAPEPRLEPVESLPAAPAAPPRAKPPRDKEATKPEAKPEEPKPAEPPAATPPAPQLRMPETTNPQQITDSIARGRAVIAKVAYGPLSNVHKKAYEDSKLFAQQAEDALKANNLALAKELADKAERLAKELQGRF